MPYYLHDKSVISPECNILDIDSDIILQLEGLLNDGKSWQRLLQVMPTDLCSLDQGNKFQRSSSSTTPAYDLLLHLGSLGVTVGMMVCWLEKICLERALLLLKEDEPLEIVEQPVPSIEIEESSYSRLELTCKAKGYPKPFYQWFKGKEELIAQQSSTINISPVTHADSGLYVCRVHNWNRKSGKVNYLFSKVAEVKVVPLSSNVSSCSLNNSKLQETSLFTETESNSSINYQQIFIKDCLEHSEIHSQEKISVGLESSFLATLKQENTPPKIIRQPISPCKGKITQGSSVCLHCEGRSSQTIKYQWLQNGLLMKGETNPCLTLHDLYPDPESGESIWYFNCLLYNDYGGVLTNSVEIELDNPSEYTQYFAEDKIALIIANDTYDSQKLCDLRVPASDAETLSGLLQILEFKVLSFRNLNKEEMENAIKLFCRYLRKGTYGVFCYIGHGFEQYGQCYLQPVDCTVFVPKECICAEYVIQSMQEENPALCVLLLDTCRALPPQYRQGEDLIPGEIFEPNMRKNSVIGYATSFLCQSYETNEDKNGFFVKYLQKHLLKKKKITDILFAVQQEFESDKMVRRQQHPWISSSLSLNRTLADPIIGHDITFKEINKEWKSITSVPNSITLNLPSTPIVVDLNFDDRENLFCNCLSILVKIRASNDEPVPLCEYDATIQFTDNVEIEYSPPHSQTETATEKACCMINVCHLQKFHKEPLIGRVWVIHFRKVVDVIDVDFGHPLIAKFSYI